MQVHAADAVMLPPVRSQLSGAQALPYCHDGPVCADLAAAVATIRPSVLIGISDGGPPIAFTREVCGAMAAHHAAPLILPLSQPGARPPASSPWVAPQRMARCAARRRAAASPRAQHASAEPPACAFRLGALRFAPAALHSLPLQACWVAISAWLHAPAEPHLFISLIFLNFLCAHRPGRRRGVGRGRVRLDGRPRGVCGPHAPRARRIHHAPGRPPDAAGCGARAVRAQHEALYHAAAQCMPPDHTRQTVWLPLWALVIVCLLQRPSHIYMGCSRVRTCWAQAAWCPAAAQAA